MKRFLVMATLAMALLAPGAAGTAATPAAVLTDADRKDIKRIEDYIASIDTVQARFMQVSSDGAYAEGEFYMDRPGRMRIDYAPPVPVEVIATGNFLVYHDKKLKQVSYVPLGSTPAGLLLDDKPALSGDVTVTGIERGPGAIRVSVAQADDPGAGSITLVFSDGPLVLRKWVVTDAQGVEITVSLLDTHFGGKLDSDLFRFVDPYMGRRDD